MTVLYSQDFEAAPNGDLANWTTNTPNFQVAAASSFGMTAAGGTRALFGNADGADFIYTPTISDDQVIRFATKVPALDTTNFRMMYALLRSTGVTAPTPGYHFYPETDGTKIRFTIYKNIAGGFTAIATSLYVFAPSPTSIVHFEARAVGTAIEVRAWVNGTARPSTAADNSASALMLGVVDSAITGGKAALRMRGANQYVQADNLVIADGTGGEDFFYNGTTPVSFSGPVPTRNGIVGTAASFANAGFFAGSQTPFAYTNVGSALPAGLTLSSSTGIISGTPTTAATTSGIIVRATDASSNVANTNSYSIVIAASNAAPTFPGNISNISGTAGTAITPVNVSGQFSDTDTLTYSASPAGTAWPSGLVVNSSTGIISGTVAGAGTTTGLKVRATDTASQTVDSNTFNAVIASAGATVTITSPSAGGKRVADGTYRASVACNVTALDKSTHAVLERKTGLTSPASGAFSFTSTVLTAGTERLFLVKADADDKDLGAFFATPV